MRREIAAVVFFLKRLVTKGDKVESDKVDLFVERLAVALQEKFKGHWYPDNPSKGHAHRCIRVNRFYKQDPEILRACQESGIQYSDLGLPRELTLWVDPGEVCCRYGEQNPCFSVATFCSDEEDKDVTKKVTTALERVTSDYHSGSSSDEESTHTSPHSMPISRCTIQAMNPDAPSWHPRKTVPGKGPIPSRPHYGFRPCSRAPLTTTITRHSLWVSPGFRGGSGYWDTNHSLAHCYS